MSSASPIELLGPAERIRLAASLVDQADQRYATDLWAWLSECVTTIDEASQVRFEWPGDLGYLKELAQALLEIKFLVIPKSRRMMVSWLCAAYACWLARYQANRAIIFQSKTEDDAAYILDKRIAFIEGNLRLPELERKYRPIRTTKGAIGRITYVKTGSYIWAISQGEHVVRSLTYSNLIMDEADFQPEGHEALQAALPQLEKGSQLVLVSSSNGPRGIVAEICKEIGMVRWEGA